MGGKNATTEVVESFPESPFGKVTDIEDDPGSVQLPQQRSSALGQSARSLSAVRVGADSVVTQTDNPKPFLPPVLDEVLGDDAVSPFHAEDVTDRCRRTVRLPCRQMGIESLGVTDLTQYSLALHEPIVSQLTLALGVGDILRPDSRKALAHRGETAVDGDDDESEITATQFLEADDPGPATLLPHAGLRLSNGPDGLHKIPVPLQGAVGNVQV